MTHLDLCTGIGGFHLAAERAGFRTLGFSETDPFCSKLLAEKWPEIPNYGDLRTADFSGLRGRISVLSAGVPCQPSSLAGKRRGASDDRWLWEAVLDVVGSVEPAWALFENPPGIVSLGEFGGILLRLAGLGYQVRMFSVPANAVGAKHRRERVFVIANRAVLLGSEEQRMQPDRADELLGAGEALADTDGQRFEERQERHGDPEQSRFEASCRDDVERCDKALADTAVKQTSELRESWQLCGFRLTQPPLCRRTDGIPDRSHRLKALGNSVVPQQAYPFFATIAQTMEAY